jgi:tRNA pseudouridine38-40 synthase
MRRIRMTVAYDGGGFHGWQVQPGLPTIQGALEEILSGMEGRPVHVAGSGRTDAGVHALAQVAAFSIENPIPLPNLKRAVNRLLPATIRVLSIEEAAAEFHPRFDALAKTYEYRMVRADVCSPFEWPYVHHYPYPLDEERMIRFARVFEGEHDFSAFAASDVRDAEGKSKVRTVYSSTLEKSPGRLTYRVRGSGFLKHMVRNLVGTLIEAGRGQIAGVTEFPAKSGPTAPAKGLFLVGVEYPAKPNPWLAIPLGDYEGHMGSEGVAQLQALAELFGAAVELVKPESLAVLGVAGGNGLDRIDCSITRRVAGVDINPAYLESVRERFADLPGLELHRVDLTCRMLRIPPVEMVHAALIFEHAGIGLCLESALALVKPGGAISVVLQLPSQSEAGVSTSRYPSIEAVREDFRLIDPTDFSAILARRGFRLSHETRVALALGKAFWHGIFNSPAAS